MTEEPDVWSAEADQLHAKLNKEIDHYIDQYQLGFTAGWDAALQWAGLWELK